MLGYEIIFWGSVGLILYTYAGYPLILIAWSKLAPRPVKKEPMTPSVSLVICAYNEAQVIHKKLKNCLALDYPKDKLEIIVASDGSTDETDKIVKQFSSKGIKLLRPSFERAGKALALSEAVPKAKGEIVVFSDARQMFDHNVVRELVANFADPQVGAVSGELYLDQFSPTRLGEGVALYWNYEKLIRKLESKIDSVVGVTGAIYAIRKSLFESLSAETILDDLVIPMRIVMRGYRVVFEPRAKAHDRASASLKEEWVRKVRTLAGNYQSLYQMPETLNPLKNRLFFQFISHKSCRVLVPFAMIGALIANLFLRENLYLITLITQGVVYMLGILGFLLRRESKSFRLFLIPQTLLVLNASALVGLVQFLKGRPADFWRKV